MSPLKFNVPNILGLLEKMDDKTLDQQPFGIVRMLPDGEVVSYNRYESNLSGLSAANTIGQNFFVQVAPCTNNFMVAHRYSQETNLDSEIDYLFTYGMKPTQVKLRLLRAARGYCYLLVQTV